MNCESEKEKKIVIINTIIPSENQDQNRETEYIILKNLTDNCMLKKKCDFYYPMVKLDEPIYLHIEYMCLLTGNLKILILIID